MPVSLEISNGENVGSGTFEKIFSYFADVDAQFSTYKPQSEVSKINRGEILPKDTSRKMQNIFLLAEQTRRQTYGYFNIATPQGNIDPSGIVKGWAIYQASLILRQEGIVNFCLEAGGDIQTGKPSEKKRGFWKVGIRNPFNRREIIKVLHLYNQGIATSGTYIRGQHIYNPHDPQKEIKEAVSLTVIGPNVYEADRFATAAFAMGRQGINFIEQTPGLEGYMVGQSGIATMTSGFGKFVI